MAREEGAEMIFKAHARYRYGNIELREEHYKAVAKDLELIHRDAVDRRRFVVV